MRWIFLLLAVLSVLKPTDATPDPLEHAMGLNYKVAFSQKPPPRGLSKEQYYSMRLRNGSFFVCVLPEVLLEQRSSAALFEANSEVPVKFIERIHERFKKVCINLLEGWWTYRLCWNDAIVQVHLPTVILSDGVLLTTEPQGPQTQFLLGTSPSKDDLNFRYGVDALGNRYIFTKYPNGEVCDLTNAPRETEVRLYCARDNEEEKMTLREVEVCRYVVSLTSRHACIQELQQEVTQRTITCHELV
ncbi:hypothetical protein, conserved [Trypanosoma cruzi]|uniref:MRH domain-containing protein n=1 Tax=Trypanosoma cruzi (strain CL Brener) TaxID=353153 RepID=Q4DFG0_TRYCC|nr:hypothetical protein, conserved [Trypanosoma cruzi]EAN91270.1 hypothetical protein, conserved [Trypanosoma cruzi]|eukprot:XP_813121.1 hypothetical protein [Trypanosoma cruzi strain CL Brener]